MTTLQERYEKLPETGMTTLEFISQEVERAKIETMQDLMKEWLYRRGMYEKFEDGKVPLVIVDNLLGGLSDNNK